MIGTQGAVFASQSENVHTVSAADGYYDVCSVYSMIVGLTR